jgi:transcriptional regulator with XRE-family HTH domain
VARVNGRRLKELRERMGYTQQELAHEVGMTLGTISKLETGKNNNPELQSLAVIAKALDIPVTELILND